MVQNNLADNYTTNISTLKTSDVVREEALIGKKPPNSAFYVSLTDKAIEIL